MQSKKSLENIQKINETKKQSKYNFFKKCMSDKLYIICFIIVVAFFSISTFDKIHRDTTKEPNTNDSAVKEMKSTSTLEPQVLDISDYVGVYSRSITMKTPVKVNPLCSIDSYKYIYQVKSDKTINKYYYNACIGSILIKSDKLNYVTYSGARYIGTEDMNFSFAPNTLKEIDGYTYKIDEDIVVIKEDKRIDDVNLDFYADNIVITTKDNIYLVNEKDIKYKLPNEYLSEYSPLDKSVYKSNIKYQYNFITYKNESTNYCYTFTEENENTKNDIAYYIYTIRYDVNTNKFMDVKEVVARTKEDSCSNYAEDLKLLQE